MKVGEFFVALAYQAQSRGVDVVDPDGAFGDLMADFAGLAGGATAFCPISLYRFRKRSYRSPLGLRKRGGAWAQDGGIGLNARVAEQSKSCDNLAGKLGASGSFIVPK